MSYKAKDLLVDLTYGHGLSGKRRTASYRNWKRYVWANLALIPLAMLAVIGGYTIHNQHASWLIYLIVSIAVLSGISWYGYFKRDTHWQLWSRERHATKQNRQSNLDELLADIEQVKNGTKHER